MALDHQRKKFRVLLGKIGFDGHDRGIKIIATVLRDAGYEVIYLGKYLTEESVVRAAIDEDVDVIGLSFLGGSHVVHSREMVKLMKENGIENTLLFVGGVIPQKDIPELKKIGVNGIFPANTMTQEILQTLEQNLSRRV
jgi:methylmalonyl-CoA mutase C-terminal domain/subunit